MNFCTNCGATFEGKEFCTNCGTAVDEEIYQDPPVQLLEGIPSETSNPFCTNCGTKVEGAKFCTNCGATLEQESVLESQRKGLETTRKEASNMSVAPPPQAKPPARTEQEASPVSVAAISKSQARMVQCSNCGRPCYLHEAFCSGCGKPTHSKEHASTNTATSDPPAASPSVILNPFANNVSAISSTAGAQTSSSVIGPTSLPASRNLVLGDYAPYAAMAGFTVVVVVPLTYWVATEATKWFIYLLLSYAGAMYGGFREWFKGYTCPRCGGTMSYRVAVKRRIIVPDHWRYLKRRDCRSCGHSGWTYSTDVGEFGSSKPV